MWTILKQKIVIHTGKQTEGLKEPAATDQCKSFRVAGSSQNQQRQFVNSYL